MAAFSSLKHSEYRVVGEGRINVELSSAQFLLALKISALFIVKGQYIVKLELEHLELCLALVAESECSHHHSQQPNGVNTHQSDFIASQQLLLGFPIMG